MTFSEQIIVWYQQHKREMPWRGIRDPYRIWLSEIILQQTRVEQGLPYYEKFVKSFPTVKHLATAPADKVMKLWQGLGYYSRARNLHATAKEIVKTHKGKFPDEHADIIKLKGIGEYTASAILSFAFEKSYPVVDGNVYRLLSRYFGVDTPIDSGKAKKEFYVLAQSLIDGHPPGIFNQAIMEFGSVQCKPANPDCMHCPLHESCFAFRNKIVQDLPVKAKAAKARNRYFHYLVIRQNGKLFLNKRTAKDIWKNLYDFPLIETAKRTTAKKLMLAKEWKGYFKGVKMKTGRVSSDHKHLLSHQTIHARFYEIELKRGEVLKDKGIIAVSSKQLKRYAVPKLIERYLESS